MIGTVRASEVRAAVVGGGVMGRSVATWLAREGAAVTLASRQAGTLRELRDHGVEGCRAAASYADLDGAEILFECVAEDLTLKRSVLAAIESAAPGAGILATSTGSLPIDAIASAVARPDRVLGVHFFQPDHVTRVVEVVRGEATSEVTLERTLAILRALRREPIVVKEGPGFLVNRLASVYLSGALRLAESGIAAPRDIDQAMRAWGMGTGPFEMGDAIGLDVLREVTFRLAQAAPGKYRASPLLDALVREGRLGRRVGRGIYNYDDAVNGAGGRSRGGPLVDRVIAPIIGEAMTCLREGIATAEAIDRAAVECLRMPEGPLALAQRAAEQAGFDRPLPRD